jgi:hypothetical protein
MKYVSVLRTCCLVLVYKIRIFQLKKHYHTQENVRSHLPRPYQCVELVHCPTNRENLIFLQHKHAQRRLHHVVWDPKMEWTPFLQSCKERGFSSFLQSDINQVRWEKNLKDVNILTARLRKCKENVKYSSASTYFFTCFFL